MPQNEMQWSSATPGLLIIMLDQSGSMLSPYEGGESRTVFATKAVNRVIDTIIQKNFNGTQPKNRCQIEVIGYNHEIKELASGKLSELDAHPLRLESVTQKILDGAGGVIDTTKQMPVWVDPITEDGATNMKGAFELAERKIGEWLNNYPQNPAPVIINISDGVPYFDGKPIEVCMKETIEVVNHIKSIENQDGKIQIFNAMIGEAAHCVFPSSRAEVTGPEAEFLFEISTEIPDSYKNAAQQTGLHFTAGARGMISRADGIELISLIHFGSTKGIADVR